MQTQNPRRSRAFLAALTLLTALGSAQATIFKDKELDALSDANKFAELERLAQTRLKANPADAEASAALSLALSSLDSSDKKRVEAGANQAKACVEQHPTVAVCQLVTAQSLNVQMGSAGMFKMASMLGDIKAALIRTLELEPSMAMARIQLAKLYLFAPGMLGGSVAKARELEAAVHNSQPEQARIIRINIAAEGKKWAEMEAELLALKPAKDVTLLDESRSAYLQLATHYLKDEKDFTKAKSLFEQLQREQPSQAAGVYGLGRVHGEMGQFDEAVRLFERARTLEGADDLPIDHRLGDALLAKGDKPQAKAAYERFLTKKNANPNNVDAARKSLAKLS
ncbi:tetratricopeptide repeat protein [Paucibacter sp. B2R-40]|uniref:tetratricopeptide repeat protein n=1 Tax=Paucibacter sp. B2R-40 TaxID=2893554 RepID=UPI0021E4E152|nr:tetratricopeptide repeat protein [Paucibacter sp. B2R-40]MCV2356772.1 tetratricopeptide repeat protein [Paucibacter sp. B2R-40]